MSCAKNILPIHSTNFIGRDNEVKELVALLGDERCRLLTLVGPGGIGKTRLAEQAARRFSQQDENNYSPVFADGIFFVALQSVSSPNHVSSTIASVLNWEHYEGNDPKAELLAYMSDKHILLILDNFEHLLSATPLVLEILQKSPGSKVLATTRVILNLADEWLYRVAGMSYPPSMGDGEFTISDALCLFAERALRVRNDFLLEQERAHVLRICQLVEGVPLAIELAATWLRRTSCVEIANEIERGIDILASDQYGVPERHRTMRAVFDYSWRLLSHEEQDALMALSVFRGGFLREAAEKITGATLPILSSLVDKSLLHVSTAGRYSMHELQRQYAAERLSYVPPREVRVRDLHSEYYLAIVAQPPHNFRSSESKSLIKRIETEIDNVLAAWDWALERRMISELYSSLEGMYWFAWLGRYHVECEDTFYKTLEVLREDQTNELVRLTYATTLQKLGAMHLWLGDSQKAEKEVRQSISILRTIPCAVRELGIAVGVLGWLMLGGTDTEAAKSLLLEAVDLDKRAQNLDLLGWSYCLLGIIAFRQSDYLDSEQWYLRALKLSRTNGDQRTIAESLQALGALASLRGDYYESQQLYEEGLSVAMRNEIAAFKVSIHRNLGELAIISGELNAASRAIERSLEIIQDWGKADTKAVSSTIALAYVRCYQGDHTSAWELHRQAAEIASAEGNHESQISLHALAGELGLRTGEYVTAYNAYRQCLTLSDQIDDQLNAARAQVGLCLISIRQGQYAEARRLLIAALQSQLSINLAPLILEGVAAAAELLAAHGDNSYSARLTHLVEMHPACTSRTRQQVQRLLAQLTLILEPEALDRATQQVAETNLRTVASRLLADLSVGYDTPANNLVYSSDQPIIEPLSERELQVLRMVADGKSNQEIARELYLALSTVKSHLHHIFKKLDVKSRTQAVARAVDQRLL